jgi:choline dehydrogenase-like flavoprotein
MSSTNTTYDYIIVGGGTAGVVIASRLKQYFPDARIALLEAGPNAVDHPKVNDITNPTAWLDLMGEGLVLDYSTTPQEHLNNREIHNPAGRLLSGNSGVNLGYWSRASSTDLKLMAERAGSDRFLFKNMLKYFRKLETYFDVAADGEYYGSDGLIHTVGGRKYPLREKLQTSAEQLGHRYNPDAAKGDSIGLADFVQCFKATSESAATRQHSAKVYDLSNVNVLCDAPVAKVLFDGNRRAVGVQLLSGESLWATKEVVVSCGTQRTPQLLMLSGVGASSELSKHNIDTIVEAPAVGHNLFDHSALPQFYKLKDPSKGQSFPFTGTKRPEYSQGLPIDFGLFANIPASELKQQLSADGIRELDKHPMLTDNRCHFLSMPIYYPPGAPSPVYPTVTKEGAHITLMALHMFPLSRGTVTLKSADPNDYPVCNPRFLSTHTDRYILRRAVRENMRLASTVPFADEIDGEVAPADPKFGVLTTESSDEEIDARIRAFSAIVFHPMGTCALGTVLDSEFRVKGAEGLRVCDASVFPEPIAVMPSCTVYALAEMCADLIAGRA